jgi:hypothetical protein
MSFKYIYLEPELNQSSLITASPFIFIVIFAIYMIDYYKRRWATNPCEGDLAFLAPLFGSSTNEWAKRCLHAPLEGTLYKLKKNINTLETEVKRTSVFEPLLKTFNEKFMKWSTQLKLANSQLKEEGKILSIPNKGKGKKSKSRFRYRGRR